jgi:hypothetical protein
MNKDDDRNLDLDEIIEDMRRQNARYMYQLHLNTCQECRTAGTLCDVGWILSRQLMQS